MDKGAKLNRRVWQLFSNAGFFTKPNKDDSKEHVVVLRGKKQRSIDLYAEDGNLKVKIIGSNKSGDVDSFSAHVSDYAEIRENGDFSKLLFVFTEKKLSSADIAFARDVNATVWTIKDLEYYETLVDTIGQFAKYEILHNLEIETREEDSALNVLALRIKQPFSNSNCELFTFVASPENLLKICVVYRKALESSGNASKAYQRMINKKRLPKIAEFVSQTNSILPVNVIVNLSDDVEVSEIKMDELFFINKRKAKFTQGDSDLVRLSIPMRYASLELIDGQHRLFGFSKCQYPDVVSNYNLVVLGLRGLDAENKKRTFVAINDNSRRMDPNLVSFLKYTDDEQLCQNDHGLMAIKVVFELNKITPFLDAIKLVDVGNQKITLKGFSGYDLQGLVGERGELRKYYPNNLSAEYISSLRIYFSCVREVFKDEWKNPDKYLIATNRGISAFLKLLKTMLRIEGRQIDRVYVLKYLTALKNNWIHPWETKALKASYVGSQGWSSLYKDMARAIRKSYREFQ